ncbi:MAG: signal peptidase II [Clostridia bacterium]|nr:signal peptidase II [Clostridia bacterium]
MTKYKNFYTFISYFLLAAAGLLLDQVSKAWAVAELKPIRSVVLIDNIISLTYRENTGAAFSILEEHTEFLTVITIFVTLLLSYIVISGKIKNAVAEYALVFIAIGGVGNCIDRISLGYVVDMFEFTFISFAIFNVADIYVTCGSALFILIFLFSKGDIFRWK